MTELRAGAATDVGLVRANNQDQLLVAFPLFAVADGMGGHAAGEVASLTAVQALHAAFERHGGRTPQALVEAAHAANRAVWERAATDREFHGMGTTLVAVALVEVDGRDELSVVNVGDSRLYLLRHGELRQLTVDHSLVQELVTGGQLAEEDAAFHPQRHVLTRALGVDPHVEVDLLELGPVAGDRLLLCSDGLSKEISDDIMASVLRRLADPDEAAKELVNIAKASGGNDNITVVIVDVVEAGPGTAADDTVATSTLIVERGEGLDEGLGEELDEEVDKGIAGDAPAASLTGRARRGAEGVAVTRRQRRQTAREATGRPPARLLTGRVVAFFLLFVVLLGLAAGGIGWYARGTYYVGLERSALTIYQGRPGGFLWFKPTVAARTGATTATVLPSRLLDLEAGHEVTSLGAARLYVTNLTAEFRRAQQADHPTTAPGPDATTATSTGPSTATTSATP